LQLEAALCFINSDAIVYALFNNTSSVLQVNNFAATTGTCGTANAGGFTLGNSGGGGSGVHTIVKEVIIYDRVLTAAEILKVKNYLSKKWGIAL